MSTSTGLITVFASSLFLSLSHIMLVYAFDTREPSPPRPPRIGRSKVRSVARSMTWKASAEFRLNAIICIFIRGRHAATMKPAILKSVSTLVAKIHREKVSIDSRVYTWRERFSRERWAVALVCSEFYRRFQFFASIDFCLKLFFFFNLY